jgi:hypothetical protein
MEDKEIDMGKLILQRLEKDRSIAWLGRQIGYNDASLGRLLKKNKHLDSSLLLRISKAMKYDFFVHYSIFLLENKYVDENQALLKILSEL